MIEQIKVTTSNIEKPNTRAVLLEGLRQALQARVGQIWSNVTLAGETNTKARFEEGITKAIYFYESAWKAIHEVTKESE